MSAAHAATALLVLLAWAPHVHAGAEPVAAEAVAPATAVERMPPVLHERAALEIERPPPDLPAARPGGASRGRPAARAAAAAAADHGGAAVPPPAPAQPAAELPTSLVPMARAQLAAARSAKAVAYRLAEDDRVIVLDLPDLKVQGQRFVRIVLFVERGGAPHDRVLTLAQARAWLAARHEHFAALTVGNNIRAAEFARFFNTARFQGEPLTVDERRLLEDLKAWGVLREGEEGVTVAMPERIVVSAPQPSEVSGCSGCAVSAAHRAVILEHELAHARFFTDTVYRDHATWFWHNQMPEALRDKFLAFLAQRGYDTGNTELVVNEMQAFLMHTPDRAMFSAAAVGLADDELEHLRRRFAEGAGPHAAAPTPQGYRFE